MKKSCLLLIAVLVSVVVKSQPYDSPYPIIFVHGLNSDDRTWNNTITQLSGSFQLSSAHTLSAVINSRGGDTTLYLSDVVIPLRDASGTIVNALSASSLYCINYGNFWNRNVSDPRIFIYDNTTPGSNQSPSNQSAISKQAYVLKIMIDSVLRITGAEKIILVGHSMGGLAIREYLQRVENGTHKWWIDPSDSSGHKVARVVTTGTPHLGTNVTSNPFINIDNSSEAMRDLKYSFPSNVPATFLFGNLEQIVPASYYNKDVNCNGTSNDTIRGLDTNSHDNPWQHLPLNITYSWITANYLGLGTDGAVPLSRQSLYNGSNVAPAGVADTLLSNKNHIQETSDARSIIRGLDEPDFPQFAYSVASSKSYAGFITLQPNASVHDSDYYKINIPEKGVLKVAVNPLNSGVTVIALAEDNGSILASKNTGNQTDSVSGSVEAGNYFFKVNGNSSLNPNQNSYKFSVSFTPAAKLNLTIGLEGMWNGTKQVRDSIRVFLRISVSPFNKIDSSISFLDTMGMCQLRYANIQSGNYYLQTLHRNALETWSSSSIPISAGSETNFDFTNDQMKAYGSNQILISGRWCIYSGDVDNDDAIDLSDILIIYNDAQSFLTGYIDSDLNGDSFADVSDLIIAFNNSSDFVAVIRP